MANQDGNVGADAGRGSRRQWPGVHTRPLAGTPRPRSIEGTPPSRGLIVRNVTTPLGSDCGQYGSRKRDWMPQWAQDGPRSEGQRPKGGGKA